MCPQLLWYLGRCVQPWSSHRVALTPYRDFLAISGHVVGANGSSQTNRQLIGLATSQLNPLRTLSKALMKRLDVETVKRHGELWPGGDIRILGNQWLRAAYVDSGLEKVPRENSFRACVDTLVKRKNLRPKLSDPGLAESQWFYWVHLGTCFPFLSKGLGKTDDELEAWVIDQAPCMVLHVFVDDAHMIESNC